MANGAEQITLISAGLDASNYEAGARKIEAANQRIAASGRQMENAGERTTSRITTSARQYDKLVQSLDASARAAAQYAAAEDKINRATTAGHASLAEKNRLLGLARERYLGIAPAAEQATGAIKLQGYQVQNLAAQFTDLAVQIGSGGGLFRPLLQQTPQAVDAVGGVGKAMGLLKQNAGALVTGGVIAGVVGGLGLIAAASERNERAITGLSNRLVTSRGDFATAATAINSAARELAASTSLTTEQARNSLARIAEIPEDRKSIV